MMMMLRDRTVWRHPSRGVPPRPYYNFFNNFNILSSAHAGFGELDRDP
jgi:hypothetical protein